MFACHILIPWWVLCVKKNHSLQWETCETNDFLTNLLLGTESAMVVFERMFASSVLANKRIRLSEISLVSNLAR